MDMYTINHGFATRILMVTALIGGADHKIIVQEKITIFALITEEGKDLFTLDARKQDYLEQIASAMKLKLVMKIARETVKMDYAPQQDFVTT